MADAMANDPPSAQPSFSADDFFLASASLYSPPISAMQFSYYVGDPHPNMASWSPVTLTRQFNPVTMSSDSRPTETSEVDDVIEVHRNSVTGPDWEGITVLHCTCGTYHEPKGQSWGDVNIFPDPLLTPGLEPAVINAEQQRIPNFYKNTIQIHQICVVEAMRINCLVVGITERMFCEDSSESPFYRPHLERETDREGTISSVQSIFRTIKHDLRPSKTQIEKSHHPYIDVMPIPSVRERLIEMQHESDEDLFFYDMIRGFRCWGGRRESQRDQGYGSGTAWDSRSWEATPEFLRKWQCILGDEHGEVARQSRWWRAMRGEEEI